MYLVMAGTTLTVRKPGHNPKIYLVAKKEEVKYEVNLTS